MCRTLDRPRIFFFAISMLGLLMLPDLASAEADLDRYSIGGGPIMVEHRHGLGSPERIRLIDVREGERFPGLRIWQRESRILRPPADALTSGFAPNISLHANPAAFTLDNEALVVLSSGAVIRIEFDPAWRGDLTVATLPFDFRLHANRRSRAYVVISNGDGRIVERVLEIDEYGALREFDPRMLKQSRITHTDMLGRLDRPDSAGAGPYESLMRATEAMVFNPSNPMLGFAKSGSVQMSRWRRPFEIANVPPRNPFARTGVHQSDAIDVRTLLEEQQLFVVAYEDGGVAVAEDVGDYVVRAWLLPPALAEERRVIARIESLRGGRVRLSRGGRTLEVDALKALAQATGQRGPRTACAAYFGKGI